MASIDNTGEVASPTGTSVSQQASSIAHEARDAAQGLGTQLLDKAEELGTHIRDKAQEIGTQAQALGTHAQEAVSEYYEQGRETLQALPQTMEAQIRARPFEALLLAAGIGLLLGLLWRRS